MCGGRRHARIDKSVVKSGGNVHTLWSRTFAGTCVCQCTGGYSQVRERKRILAPEACACADPQTQCSAAWRMSIWPAMVAVPAIAHLLGQETALESASSEGEGKSEGSG